MRLIGRDGILGSEDPRRLESGLVYLDPNCATRPATHVIVIGVGAFPTSEALKPLSSTTVSARAVADWFLGELASAKQEGGFRNETKPLGSLALLLSEKDVVPNESVYAGGPVPRATFEATERALAAWVDRCNSHMENLAISLVCSHGSIKGARSFFVLEDYGSKKYKPTFGMSEVEQIRLALEAARPLDQLLMFDCCRLPGSGDLPYEATIGDVLIGPVPLDDDPGQPRRQMVIQSACQGQAASGREGKTSLFVDGLLCGLDGAASDFATALSPVRPGILATHLQRMLELHRFTSEQLQMPQSRIVGDFEITFPPRSPNVQLFVSSEDKQVWPGTEVQLRDDVSWTKTVKGRAEPLFEQVTAPRGATIKATAYREGAEIGQAEAQLFAPAYFLKIDRREPQAQALAGLPPRRRSARVHGHSAAKFKVIVRGPAAVAAGAFLVITSLPDEGQLIEHEGQRIERTVDILSFSSTDDLAQEIGLERAGTFRFELRLPDGTTQERVEQVASRGVKLVRFEMAHSAHEWLRGPTIVGLAQTSSSLALGAPEVSVHVISPPKNLEDALHGGPESLVEAPLLERRDETIVGYTLAEWPGGGARPSEGPFFIRVDSGQRVELAALAQLPPGRQDKMNWSPYVIINSLAASDSAITAVTIIEGPSGIDGASRWSGLIGFLGHRDFRSGASVLAELGDVAWSAMREKMENPFAAAAGALVLVGVGGDAPDRLKSEMSGDWLENLAKWFPTLPDSAIILGRQRLVTARTRGERAVAKTWLEQGFSRGVPLYSLSVEWLAGGLERLAVEHPELAEKAKVARAVSNRVDHRQAFTVIRLR